MENSKKPAGGSSFFSFLNEKAAPASEKPQNSPEKSSFFSFFKKKSAPSAQSAPDTPSAQETAPKSGDIEIEKVEERKYAKAPVEVRPSDKILENIVSRKTSHDLPRLILGPKPGKTAPDIIQFSVENKLKAAKTFFQIVVIVAILSAVFFKVELDTNFHLFEKYLDFPTLANELSTLSSDLLAAQTNINFYNTALSKFHLDKFVYLYNYRGMASAKAEDLEELQESLAIIKKTAGSPLYNNDGIPTLYAQISLPVGIDGIPQPLDTYLSDTYKQALLTSISQQKESLRQKIPADGSDDAYPEIKIMDGLPVLVEKKASLATSLSEYDPETLTTASVKKLVKAFNDISKNDYAVISAIKDKRISWTQNLINIENITKKVDFYFGEPGVADLAKVFYRSYAFDADKNTITVNGEIRTDNVMVFSELIELIEAFETAPEFKLTNEIRKFAKSEQEEKYVTQFQFVLFINPAAEVPVESLGESLVEPPDEIPVEAPADTGSDNENTDQKDISGSEEPVQENVDTSEESLLPIMEETPSESDTVSNDSALPDVEQPESKGTHAPAPRT